MQVIMILILYWLIFIAPYSLLITILFMLFSYPIHFHDSIKYDQMMYACAPFSHFYTLIGSSDSLHIQVYSCYILLLRYLERNSCIATCKELGLIHLIFWSWVLFLLCSSFLVSFIWFSISSGLYFILFDLFIEWYYHAWKIYLFYCSDFVAFIVGDICNLFRSL